ncbi:MAG: CoA transferase [bacterium]|nr:CoA transferase [bacterium]
MSQPLQGLRVLDLTRLIPGGVCTMMMVDLGADVIKIEDPNGGDYARWMGPQIDGQSVFFRATNRGKRSMILNLKDVRGQDVLKKLVEGADVLIEGFRPGVMARLNCDEATLRQINPRLIYCSLSGWGTDGPYADMGNHDLNYVSLAGLTAAMETPQVMGGQMADIAGAYIALSGILAALLRRERTGEGGYVDASLAESALPFALYNWVEALLMAGMGGSPYPNGRGTLSGGQACYRVYTTRDGQHVALGALEEKFWHNFCNAVERPDLIEGYLDPSRQKYLITEVSEIFLMQTADEWEAELGAVDCCFTRVTPTGQIADDAHFRARNLLGIFEDGTPWMRSPVRLSDSQPLIENMIPGYGVHTGAVLSEAGFSATDIEALASAGIIRQG